MRAFRWLAASGLVFFVTCAYSASKTVLVLGDSLSAEYGIARGSGWVALLEKRLKQENIPASIINASISGETTSGGKTRLPTLLKKYNPDVVVIELGGNDGLRGLPLASTKANLRDMIAASRKANADVLLVGMRIPPNYGREYTEKFYGMYPNLAREYKAALTPFLLEGIADDKSQMQADRIHPRAEAQPKIMDKVWTQLKGFLVK